MFGSINENFWICVFEHVIDFRETRKYKGNEKKLSLFLLKESVPSKSQVWALIRPHLTNKKCLALNLFIKDKKGDTGIFWLKLNEIVVELLAVLTFQVGTAFSRLKCFKYNQRNKFVTSNKKFTWIIRVTWSIV